MSLFETQRTPITLNTQYVNILHFFFYLEYSFGIKIYSNIKYI